MGLCNHATWRSFGIVCDHSNVIEIPHPSDSEKISFFFFFFPAWCILFFFFSCLMFCMCLITSELLLFKEATLFLIRILSKVHDSSSHLNKMNELMTFQQACQFCYMTPGPLRTLWIFPFFPPPISESVSELSEFCFVPELQELCTGTKKLKTSPIITDNNFFAEIASWL